MKDHIVHVVRDDKFIDLGIRHFESVHPGKNVAVRIGEHRPLKYIQSTPVQTFSPREMFSASFVRLVVGAKAVVFHSLTNHLKVLAALAALGFKGKTVWIGWGADYYNLLEPMGYELYEERTRKEFSIPMRRKSFRSVFEHALRWRLIERIDYFAPVIYDDYALLKKFRPGFRPQYIPWNYGSSALSFSTLQDRPAPTGNKILIGNSAYATNNHVDIFALEAVRRAAQAGRQLIVPLSYGDRGYADKVIAAGRRELGSSFHPLLEFLPYDRYLDLLADCSHIIFHHRRQQGMGNTGVALFMGARLFLNEVNPVLAHYRREGFHVHSVQELIENPALLERPLPEEQIAHNRTLIQARLTPQRIEENTRALVAAII